MTPNPNPNSFNQAEQLDPTEPCGLMDLADPCHAARIGAEAALLADVNKAGREIREYLGRRRRAGPGTSSGGRCVCQEGTDLLPVEVSGGDPLDLKRQARARLGAILGHCRCEPGAVAA